MNSNFHHLSRWALRLALWAGVALASLGATSARAQADPVTTSVQTPFEVAMFVPCANGGAGEWVTLTGTVHELYHLTFDASGGVHAVQQANPQGIAGVGATTGDRYRGTGMSMLEINMTVAQEGTLVNSFRIIGPGRGNNLVIRTTEHITINANGEVTVEFMNSSIECN